MFVDLQDRRVKPGETVEMDITALDPEGQPVRIEKRAGEVGELDGNRFLWTVPKEATGSFPVTFIASDATAGNSYAARRVNFDVAPAAHAHITTKGQYGVAPFTVEVSAEGSTAGGKVEFGWEFYAPEPKRKAVPFAKLVKGAKAKHTFEKPGRYEIALTVRSGDAVDRQVLPIEVTKGEPPEPPGGIGIEGNGVRIRNGADRPNDFDGTHFGTAGEGETVTRTFTLINRSSQEIAAGRGAVRIEGENAREFRVVRVPRKHVSRNGSATFELQFAPLGGGTRTATVTVQAHKGGEVTFAVAGEGAIDQAKLDAAAEALHGPAMKLLKAEKWVEAERAFRELAGKFPGTKLGREAARMLELFASDPKMKRAIEAAKRDAESTLELAKQEKRAKSLFLMAENAKKNGRADLAADYYRRIVKQYPKTTWAEKARERLE
jgi:TolA-binding protein